MNIFHSILYILLIQICECPASCGTRAYYSETSCDFFFFRFSFFFRSDRPTQYQETHLTVNKEKTGDGLMTKTKTLHEY